MCHRLFIFTLLPSVLSTDSIIIIIIIIIMAAARTKETILNSLLEDARHWRELRDYVYNLNMPLLLNPEESPLPCRETPAEFEAINSSFSSQIHALFEALNDFDSLSKTEDVDGYIHKDGLISVGRCGSCTSICPPR